MKNMLKRICALALAITMVLALTWTGGGSETALAAEGDVATGGDTVVWSITEENGGYTLTLSAGTSTEIANNYYTNWSTYLEKITKIVIKKEITKIGNSSLSNHINAEVIEFEEGSKLTTLGNKTFENCYAVKEIHLGDKLKKVGNNTFLSCESLEVLDFGKGNGSVSIGSTVTKFCPNLHTVVLPEKISGIGNNSFFQCHNLNTVYWYGSSVDEFHKLLDTSGYDVDYLAYLGTKLYVWDSASNNFVTEPVYVGVDAAGESVSAWRDYQLDDAPILFYGNGAVNSYADGKTAPWSDTVTNSKGLVNVVRIYITEYITSIGENAFADCAGINEVVYYGTEAQWNALKTASGAGNDALWNCANISYAITGSAGDAVTYLLTSSDNGMTYTLTLSGSGDTATHGDGDFNPQSEEEMPWWTIRDLITSVVVEDGITSIGGSLFDKLRSMTQLSLPSTLTTLGTYALRGCIGLTEITLVEGFENIGNATFSGCSNLQVINLPSTIRTIDLKAFEYCTDITTVNYAGYSYQWENVAIDNSQDKNRHLLNAEIICKSSPDITQYPDASSSQYKDQLQYLYERLLIEAAYSDAFGVDLLLTDEEVLTVLYLWAGADDRYENAMDWAKTNQLVEEDYEYGLMTTKKLYNLLAALEEYNGDNANYTGGDDTYITRGFGLAEVSDFLTGENSVADRLSNIESELKTVLGQSGDGNLYVIAPNLYVDNLGKKVGDCTLIIFPDGKTMLIDAGVGNPQGEGYGDTSKALLSFFEGMGLKKLDYLVVSHDHDDHYGGMLNVINYMESINEFWYSGYHINLGTILSAIDAKGTSVKTFCLETDSMDNIIKQTIGGVEVAIFGPNKEDIAIATANRSDEQVNNTSLCMKFTYGDSTFLTCGDTYISKEEKLVVAYGDWLQSDISKANHHGNWQSTGTVWAETVKSLHFIAEIDGTGNNGVKQNVESNGGIYYTTGFDGAIVVKMDNAKNYTITTQYDGVLRKQDVDPVNLLNATITETTTDADGTVTTTEMEMDLATGKATKTTITVTKTDSAGMTTITVTEIDSVGKKTITTTVLDANGNIVSVEVSGDGIKGDKGDTGAQGEKGEDGADGKDGSDGAKGDKGDTGAQGTKGDKGDTGAAGKDGADGKNGYDGIDGQDGKDGRDGADGKDGVDGKDGADGKDGVGIADVKIDENGNLIVTLSDGSVIDAGKLPEASVSTASQNGGGNGLSIMAVVISVAALAWSVLSSAKKKITK